MAKLRALIKAYNVLEWGKTTRLLTGKEMREVAATGISMMGLACFI